jgi:biopolymer transport protein ExbD
MMPLEPYDDTAGIPRLASEINVTPFIDVMLVLLVVFMVIAPLMLVGVPLKLPKTEAAMIPPAHEPIVVSLDKDDRLFIGKEPVAPADLADRLKAAVKDDPSQLVYLRADGSLDYSKVMDLLGKLGATGIGHVSLVAEGQGQAAATPNNAPP